MRKFQIAVLCLMVAGCSTDSSRQASNPAKEKFLNSLDKRQIRQSIRTHEEEIQHCAENAKDKPGAEGKLTLKWTVGAGGETKNPTVADSSLGSKDAEACAINAVKTWVFPVAPNGKSYVVGFPFVLNSTAKIAPKDGLDAPAADEAAAAAATPDAGPGPASVPSATSGDPAN